MYTVVKFNCDESQFDDIAYLLTENGFLGCAYENNEVSVYSETVAFDEKVLKDTLAIFGIESIKVETLEQQNWNKVWEENFHSVTINNIHIKAPFHDAAPGFLNITIQPNMAFGTGHHATTHLALQALSSINLNKKDVLDMGCGSGILAIYASMMGATRVLAIDYDKQCIANTEENLQLNGVNNVEVWYANNTENIVSTMDIIVSNIIKSSNFPHWKRYSELLTDDGILIASGLLSTDYGEAIEFAKQYNLKPSSHLEKDGWLMIIFTKNND